MLNLLVGFLLVATVVRAQTAAPEQMVVRRVGGNVTLDCPQLEDKDEFTGIIWNKDSAPFISIGKNQHVDYTAGSLPDRITVTSGGQIMMMSLELPDSGKYVCQIYVLQLKDGSWQPSSTAYQLVVNDVPSGPGKPEVKDVLARQTTITWTAGSPNNSPILSYNIDIRECQTNVTRRELASHASLEITVHGLSPFTCYMATVSAVNAIGHSPPSEASSQFKTLEEALPSPVTQVTNITLQPPAGAPVDFKTANVTSSMIELQWMPPATETINGDLSGFEIRYGTDYQSMKNLSIEDPQRTRAKLQGLKPFTSYIVCIQAKNKAGTGPQAAMDVITEEGLPLKPRITHISNQRATSFYVNWEPPREINGQLLKYELQWIHNGDVKSRYIAGHLIDTMTAFISDLTPYTEYKVQVAAVTKGGRGEFSDQFPALTDVAAPGPPRNLNVTDQSLNSVYMSWEPPEIFSKTIDHYLIKGFDHLGQVIEQMVKGQITKHVLKNLAPNSRYHLKVAAITNAIFSMEKCVGDFTDTAVISLGAVSETSSAELHPGVIVAIVCALLCVVTVSALVVGYRFYTCRKCYQTAFKYLAVPSNGQAIQQMVIHVEQPVEEKQYPDIAATDFIPHVRLMHMDGDIGFSQEFDEINRTSLSDKYPCDSSNVLDNRAKNRYINIVAYDHSRVVLKTELGRLRQLDYINANYVDGYKKPKAYIATQGPLPQTFTDFWRMVWEQNSNVIVMITNLMEKGRRKCDQYWPSDGAETYGNISVKLITMVPRAHYTVRVFSLRNIKMKKRHSVKGVAERTVYHYHYTEWPDHGVPDYSLPVLSFVQKSAAQCGPESGPIIVHCSAGVGRTGTYILIDSMIARVQKQRAINIPGFTQHIRRQRNFLVQTEDQYIFIHEVLVEYLLGNGDTEVKEDYLGDHLLRLEQPAQGIILPSVTTGTLLERQFQQITEYQPNEADLSAALKPVNQEKNRAGSILPINLKRVLLPARPGIDGSDYINATYLQGYKKSAEFIVTQHPTEDTMEDFWRMVWDKNSPIIVVLSPINDQEYKEFWPPPGSSIDVDSGNFRLALKDEPITDNDRGIVTSEFILDSIQYDYTLMTRIVCVKGWPELVTEVHRVFDAVVAVHSFINSLECGPIIVMDRFGGVEAGTFCALWTLRDQLLSEKCADFYQVCKLYHYKRPGIVGSEENYRFLHRAMSALHKHLHEGHAGNGSSPRHNRHLHNSSHHGSMRHNGTIAGATTHTNNKTTAAQTSINMARSPSEETSSIVTTPTLDIDKVEINI